MATTVPITPSPLQLQFNTKHVHAVERRVRDRHAAAVDAHAGSLEPMHIAEFDADAIKLYSDILPAIAECMFRRNDEWDAYFCIRVFAVLHVYYCHHKNPPRAILSQDEMVAAASAFYPNKEAIAYAAAAYISYNTRKELHSITMKSVDPTQNLTDDAMDNMYGYLRRYCVYKCMHVIDDSGFVLVEEPRNIQALFTLSNIQQLVKLDGGLWERFHVSYEHLLTPLLEETSSYNFYTSTYGTNSLVSHTKLWKVDKRDLAVVVEVVDAKLPIDERLRLDVAIISYICQLIANQTKNLHAITVRHGQGVLLAESGDICILDAGFFAVYNNGNYHRFDHVPDLIDFMCEVWIQICHAQHLPPAIFHETRAFVQGLPIDYTLLDMQHRWLLATVEV